MLCAAIKDCPVFGGKLKSYDESKILGMPGVKKVVRVKDTGVAVVADTWWRAKKALDALPIVWDEGRERHAIQRHDRRMLKEGLNATATNGDRKNGDALKAIAEAAEEDRGGLFDAVPRARARMEVMNCTVKLSADKAEAWVPTQNLEGSLAALSESSGIPLDKCEVHRHDLGGGFGRRGGTQDYVHQAVEIAKHLPGHADQDDLEPRGGSGARFLPADLAMQAVCRPRRRRQSGRPARARLGPVDQCARSIRKASSTARTCASCRAIRRRPATRSLATPCRIC